MKKIIKLKYNTVIIYILSLMLFLPIFTFAQITNIDSIGGIMGDIVAFVSDFIIPLLFTFALVFFIWKIVQFINKSDSEEERKRWKNTFVWGIVALFLMVTLIGIISVVLKSSGISISGGFLPQLVDKISN